MSVEITVAQTKYVHSLAYYSLVPRPPDQRAGTEISQTSETLPIPDIT